MRVRMQMMSLAAAGLAMAGAGCASTGQQAKFDNSRIAGLSPAALSGVNAAKEEVSEAEADRLAAENALNEYSQAVRIAESEKKVFDAEHRKAKEHAKIMKQQGEIDSIDEEPRVQAQKALMDAAKAKVSYLKALESTQKAQVSMAEKQVELAKAKVDQEGFRALQSEDPAQVRAMEQNAADFDARVAKAQSSVASKRADVARERAKAVNDYQAWLEAERQIGSADRSALAPPPSPDSMEKSEPQKKGEEIW